MCIVHDARKHEEYARKSNSVAPELIFGGVGMRMLKPLADLLFGLGSASTDDSCVGVPYLLPEANILESGGRLVKILTPPIGKSLQTSTLGGSEPSHGIACIKHSVVVTGTGAVDERVATILEEVLTNVSCSRRIEAIRMCNSSRTFGNERGLAFFCDRGHKLCVLALVESISTDAVTYGVGIFIVPC